MRVLKQREKTIRIILVGHQRWFERVDEKRAGRLSASENKSEENESLYLPIEPDPAEQVVDEVAQFEPDELRRSMLSGKWISYKKVAHSPSISIFGATRIFVDGAHSAGHAYHARCSS